MTFVFFKRVQLRLLEKRKKKKKKEKNLRQTSDLSVRPAAFK